MKIPPGYGHKPRLSPRLTGVWTDETFTLQQVSRRLGRDHETVRRSARRIGVGRRTRGAQWGFTAEEIEQLRQAIARKHGRQE